MHPTLQQVLLMLTHIQLLLASVRTAWMPPQERAALMADSSNAMSTHVICLSATRLACWSTSAVQGLSVSVSTTRDYTISTQLTCGCLYCPSLQSLLAPGADDDWYFSYWDCPDSHLAVLQDTAYQEAWSRAVAAAQHLIQDKVVLDVGCGLGMLPMLAAKVRQLGANQRGLRLPGPVGSSAGALTGSTPAQILEDVVVTATEVYVLCMGDSSCGFWPLPVLCGVSCQHPENADSPLAMCATVVQGTAPFVQAGAKHVYAVEASTGAAELARKVIAVNGLSNKITVITGRAELVDLPVKRVDVIMSDWMGNMLLHDGLLPTLLRVRDRCE